MPVRNDVSHTAVVMVALFLLVEHHIGSICPMLTQPLDNHSVNPEAAYTVTSTSTLLICDQSLWLLPAAFSNMQASAAVGLLHN